MSAANNFVDTFDACGVLGVVAIFFLLFDWSGVTCGVLTPFSLGVVVPLIWVKSILGKYVSSRGIIN